MIKKIIVLVACLLALLAVSTHAKKAEATTKRECAQCLIKCRRSDNFRACYAEFCATTCKTFKARAFAKLENKVASDAEAEFGQVFKNFGAALKEEFNSKTAHIKTKVMELAKRIKGSETLSDSELRCINTCPRGMACAAVCIPEPAVMADTMAHTMNAASSAASWARGKAGSCYSQDATRRMNECFDCSSLVYRAYKQAGVDIGAKSTGAYPGNMREVSKDNLQVGDVLWRSGHVGIYLGNNQVVNAENERTGVQVRSMDYYKSYMGFTKVYRI